MRETIIQRPVTVEKLAVALGTKPYRILSKLIRRAQFPSPHDAITDAVAIEVALSVGVDLKIIDESDGDGSEPVSSPVRPLVPPASTGKSSPTRIQDVEQVAVADRHQLDSFTPTTPQSPGG
jgi:hypothetical protein